MIREPRAEPAGPSIEQEEREADDDRRKREREVDDRVHEALARKRPAHDRQRRDDAEDGVQRDDDRCDENGEVERVERLVRRDRMPGRREAVLEGAVEDHPHRHE